MIQKVNVNYGFTQLEIASLNMSFSIIKLRFNHSSVDEIMTKFFESLGFTYREVYNKKGTRQAIYQFYVAFGSDRSSNAQNHQIYQDTCNKVREFLIRRKITGLYDQLSQINPSVSAQPMTPALEF